MLCQRIEAGLPVARAARPSSRRSLTWRGCPEPKPGLSSIIFVRSPQQVRYARLVGDGLVLAVGRPPVADQDAVVVGVRRRAASVKPRPSATL